jgi:hypothetical protein
LVAFLSDLQALKADLSWIGHESLRAICADPAMPARATLFRWLASNQEFRQLYVLARQCQAEDLAYEILEIRQ